MIAKDRLRAWQAELMSRPQVWVVIANGETGNLYDSPEAAEEEVAWRRRRGELARAECLGHLHNFRLSRERWSQRDELKQQTEDQNK